MVDELLKYLWLGNVEVAKTVNDARLERNRRKFMRWLVSD